MNRFVGPLLALVLALAVGVGIYMSASDSFKRNRLITVSGLSGSEKIPFFKDTRVIEALAERGFAVDIHKAGSRQIATAFDLSNYDFAFPAGIPAAEKIRRTVRSSKSYQVFFTPIVIATWQPIVNVLTANGIAAQKNGYIGFDTLAYRKLIDSDTRWSALENNAGYPVNKMVLLTSTDVRKSNSAAMYLALMSYVANDNRIVKNESDFAPLMPFLKGIFMRQGYLESSSQTPFDDYLLMGMGKTPMVVAYESQFIHAATPSEGGIPDDAVLMYPEPTIFTKHIFIGLTENGKKLGELLEADEMLKQLAIEHGFRNDNRAYFNQFTHGLGVDLPETIFNVIEPPSYEVVEGMIQEIELAYQGGS